MNLRFIVGKMSKRHWNKQEKKIRKEFAEKIKKRLSEKSFNWLEQQEIIDKLVEELNGTNNDKQR